nr:helix-turn-helix domain-containing protein [Actinomycetota bacterium]
MPGSALSAQEREEIRVGIEADEPLRAVARRLGRSPSTITREVARNGGQGRYRATTADRRAQLERRRPKRPKVEGNRALRDHVEQRLVAKDSPTTIARELAAAGGITGETISAETIYRGVYAHGKRGLAAGLHHYLWSWHASTDNLVVLIMPPDGRRCGGCVLRTQRGSC